MDVTLQYFDACPNWRIADERLREALERLRRHDVSVSYQQVETPEEAARVGFRGSPTILMDGRDPFDGGSAEPPTALSCRVYRTEAGPQEAPTVEQLVAALSE
jgi:hypothetical protein